MAYGGGNSDGGCHVSARDDMACFDGFPESLRTELRNAPFDAACPTVASVLADEGVDAALAGIRELMREHPRLSRIATWGADYPESQSEF